MKSSKSRSMSQKLIFVFIYTSIIALVAHLITYMNINHTINQFDSVYASNIRLSQLSDAVGKVQTNMYDYLNIKSSSALETYYISVQNFESMLEDLNDEVTDNNSLMMERHIKKMSKAYLDKTSGAVQAKRGRNIEKYNDNYNKANEIFGYINAYINSLNGTQFKYNSNNYILLRESLRYLEVVSTVVLIGVILFNVIMITILTRRITHPLMLLSEAANEIAAGNFAISLTTISTGDEIETLSKAFNKMIVSIRDYIERLCVSMETESRMKEKEFMMANHLKDAQLKYLQAQINPHFLFNTLNAGVQLAMLENAERTSIFIENMAEFFRYNITKINQETSLAEEVKLVDHYIYILNVRFAGEINYIKEIDESILDVKVPSMIIQPIVENVFQYGIRDIEWQGIITLSIYKAKDKIGIAITDNGKGMSKERIQEVINRDVKPSEGSKSSNGVGLSNVISRLRLYYEAEDVLTIESEGENKGTKVNIMIPSPQK